MRYPNILLTALAILALPTPVMAQTRPWVASSVGEVPLSNTQCLQWAAKVMTDLGYTLLTRVGDTSDTSLYAETQGLTAVIRCVTKSRIGVVILSTTGPSGEREFRDLADNFFRGL